MITLDREGTCHGLSVAGGPSILRLRPAGTAKAAATKRTSPTCCHCRRSSSVECECDRRGLPVRTRSATDLLLRALLGAPVITVTSASRLIDRSFPQTNEAIARLIGADVLTQITVGRRNRAFEAPDIIDAFANLERQLASPHGDTAISGPVRRVPRRQPPSRKPNPRAAGLRPSR